MKQTILSILLSFAALGVSAQTITTLDWDEMRIDSVLPHYSEVVPLARDFANYDFSVRLEYASWIPLTPAEELVARRFLDELGDTIVVYSAVGQSRGKGSLDIDFIPVVYDRKTETMRKLRQCKLTILATPKAKAVKRKAEEGYERWARTSVLSSGKWQKIALEDDGIYSISADMLRRMGFTDPSKVRLYGYGGRMLPEKMDADAAFDDLEEVPLLRRAGSNNDLVFWGYGVTGWDWTVTSSSTQHHTMNPYSTRGYYFLTEGDAPAHLETYGETVTSPQTITYYTHYWVRDIDEYAWFSAGRKLWEDKLLTDGRTYQIPTPGYYGGTGTLRISLANGGDEPALIESVYNDSTMATTTVPIASDYEKAGSTTKYYTLRGLKDGTGTLRITAPNDRVLLDYIEVNYPRAFRMTEAFLPFTLSQTGAVRFRIEPAYEGQEIMVQRLGTRGCPATVIPKDSEGYYAVSAAAGDYVAFDTGAAYPNPLWEGSVENQNLHADEAVEMIIITPASGIQDREAQRLADAHAMYDGVTCRVVRADKIFNEFSSGTPDATAYRRYMKMLYDRALADGKEPPRYLLLFGDGAWDNRMLSQEWRKYTPNDFLLCFESANSLSDTQSYVMEDYYGLLDDGEGARLTSDKVDIGIGRFPVRTADEGRALVDKTIDHLANPDPGSWQNLCLYLGDDGDENDHMDYACKVADIAQEYAPGMEHRKVMWDSYKRVSAATGNTFPMLTQYINKTMYEGATMINYTGHGATYLLSHENVISLADFHSYDNTRQGFWFTAACDIAPFDGLVDNIGEASVMNPKGGTKCFIGTARTVYANLNLNMNRAFCRFIFATDPESGRRYSIGDALHLGKNQLTESGTTVNKLHYIILGDPSLVFGQPQQRVVVDSINGQYVGDGASPQVMAGSRCTMAGHIEDKDGNRMTDFTGLLMSRIMDTQDTVTCLNQAGAKKAFQYAAYRKVLHEGSDSVRNGVFSFSFVVPIDINYANDKGRAIFYADGYRSDGKWVPANGYSDRYIVGGVSSELKNDSVGPKIDLWLDSENFVNGAHVSTSPVLFARIDDESGMNFSAAGIGHGLECCIDDKAEWTFDLSKTFAFDAGSSKAGRVEYQLPVLGKGSHSLRLRAWDVLNNTSTATISFVVDGTNETAPVSAFVTSQNREAVITLVNRLTGSTCDATIHLFDATGRMCFTDEVGGLGPGATTYIKVGQTALVSGVYFLQVTLKQGTRTYQSEIQKVTLKF